MESKEEVKQLEETLNKSTFKPVHNIFKGWRTRSGEVISYKEAGRRWKEAMQNLTPAQRTANDISSSIIILIGFIASIVALIFFSSTFGLVTYGLIIIFLGNIYANVIKLFSLFGQYKLYKNIEKQIGGLDG
jgi:ABC-type multidrug transport system fused ATPase/permease subunit